MIPIAGTRSVLLMAAAWVATTVAYADSQDAAIENLSSMSLEQLANVEVTSVSKSPQPLQQAAATIYVITHDQILRSGVTSVPEALRLAPNLLVTQTSASQYTIAARGLGGNTPAQNFSNKLLILIDGRSVYTPLYSGIYMDAQDVLLEDVDRIEIISGPGSTLWGANAVNGVINIITRAAYLTDGTFASVGAGNEEQNAAVRYGAKSDDFAFRVYAKAFNRDSMELADDANAHDRWGKVQGGFRADWSRGNDSATLQGDIYRATENQLGSGDSSLAGANTLTRWQHHSDSSDLQLQAYFDQTQSFQPTGGNAFVLHTYDVELQDSMLLGAADQLIWGGGERLYSYGITNSASLLFVPSSRNLTLGDVFAQDTYSLMPTLKLTAGIKFEDDPYYGWTPLPNARLAWDATDRTTLWAAASRAVRSPTPFDEDVVEKLAGSVFLTGNPDFQTEEVWAYEVGYRSQPASVLSLSVAAFYNTYNDLRTIELGSATAPIPLHWGNLMRADTDGIEAWADWQVTRWWQLSPGVSLLHEDFMFKPGSSQLLGLAQAGDDPSSHATLASSMDLGRQMTFDAQLRYVGALPNPALPSYYEMNARYGWRPSKTLELSLNGLNLLHAHHVEAAGGEEIVRSVLAEARWRF
jgi:iron complex outermembrane recepter protein